MAGTSKLFLYNSTRNIAWIPSIPRSSTFEQLPPNLTTLDDLNNAWDAQNGKDMQNTAVLILTQVFPLPTQISCGPSIFYMGPREYPDFCGIAVLGRKYNFTTNSPWHTNLEETRVVGRVNFRLGLNQDYVDIGPYQLTPLVLKIQEFGLTIVTNFPSRQGSVDTLLSPFDHLTWILLYVSTILVAMVIHMDIKILKFKPLELPKFDPIFHLLTQLVGQSSFYLVKINFKTIAVIWSIFCYILMGNLYQGSIYSCLTVMLPPSVPRTVADIVSSNLQVLTMSLVYDKVGPNGTLMYSSVLKHFILPSLIHQFPENSTIARKLSELEENLIFVHSYHIFTGELATRLSNSEETYSANKSINTVGMLAVIDRKKRVGSFHQNNENARKAQNH